MTFIKKNLLWILFFGTLIGLNETLIGSMNIPYRSVIINTITISLLSFGRLKVPRFGTSFFIICIALLFKINSTGFHTCTTNYLLCGPTALLILGVCYEIIAGIFVSKSEISYVKYALTGAISPFIAFTLFAIMNKYILGSWGSDKLVEYIFIKGSLTAVASTIITVLGVYVTRTLSRQSFVNPYFINSVLGIIIIGLWIFGSVTTLN